MSGSEQITIKYKLDKSKTYTIKVSSKSTIQELLDAVNKKHHLKLITVYSKSITSCLDLEESLSDWAQEETIFYFSDQKIIDLFVSTCYAIF